MVLRYRDSLAVRFVPSWVLAKCAGVDGRFELWCRNVLFTQHRQALAAESGALQARRESVERELGSYFDHQWAGTYVAAQQTLRIAERSGFHFLRFTRHDETAAHGDIAEVTNDRVVMRTVASLRSFGIAPQRLLRVPWQGRKYLIDETEVASFANEVNSRNTGTPHRYLHRLGDPHEPDPVLPILPAPFESYIRVAPLITKVVRVTSSPRIMKDASGKCWTADCVVDIGTKHDAFLGMTFYAMHRDTFLGATLITLGETESIVRFTDCFGEHEKIDMPSVGWKFTTIGPWAVEPSEPFDLRELDQPDDTTVESDSVAQEAD